MWAGVLLGLSSLAVSASALRALRAAELSSDESEEKWVDVYGNLVGNTTALRHVGPSNSLPIWQKFQSHDSWKQPRSSREDVKMPEGNRTEGNQSEPVPDRDEYYGPRDLPLKFIAKCFGWAVPTEPRPNEGWTVRDVRRPTLQPYIVPEGTPGRTDIAIVVVPGGGGEMLAWDTEGHDVAVWLNSIGISAFVLKHRVPSAAYGDKTLAMDGQRAVSLVKFAAPTIGVNASRVGVIGFSAGGSVATRAAVQVARLYDVVDAADGETYRPDFLLLVYSAPPLELIMPTPEDSYSINKKLLPPVFMAFSEDDPCTTSNFQLWHFGQLTGVPVELHMAPSGLHGYSTCVRYPLEFTQKVEACRWVDRAQEFIQRIYGQRGDASAAVYEAHKALLLRRKS